MSDRPHLLLRLWREHVVRHWRVLLVALVLMTIEGATLGAVSYLIRPLFDDVLLADGGGSTLWVGFAIAALFALRAASGYGQRVLIVSVGLRVTTALQSRLLAHLLTLDSRYFQDNAPGTLIERVRGDTLALQAAASNALMSLGRDVISVLSLLAVMLWNDAGWTVLALAGVPVLVLPVAALQGFIRRTTRGAREAAGRLTTRLDEIFHGNVAIKVNRLERHEAARFEAEVDRFLAAQLASERGKAANPAVIDLIAAIGFAAVFVWGGAEIVAGDKTIGAFMSFFTALALMFDPLRRLSTLMGMLQAAMASLERLYEVLDDRPTILPPARPRPVADGAVVFEDVAFSYGAGPVLRGLSFTAEAGRTTALVGPSGAGKSTIFGLIARLIEPQSGRVTIGGVPVNEVAFEDLRDRIALVGQDAALFDETIAENIRLGRLDAGGDAIRAAAIAASVTDFADSFPDGLGTRVGPRGSALSGGQRQRVAIARAMLRDAPLLLLDEPTSALDSQAEALVQRALDRLARGRTTLVIAHRLSTIRDADKIVVIEAGRTVEEGRHQELLARGGAYAKLHALQASGVQTL